MTTSKNFILKNDLGATLALCNIGAAAVSFTLKDKNGIVQDVLLGYDTQEEYLQDPFYIGTVVGRYANRINTGKIVVDGSEYQLSIKKEGFHHHGGVQGFNKKYFEGTYFENEEGKGVCFKYLSPHLEEGYPGNLSLQVEYVLYNKVNTWEVKFTATTDKSTVLNLTLHNYFNLSGDSNIGIANHLLQINADYFLPVNDLCMPIGKLERVENTSFDFLKPKMLGKHIDAQETQLLLANGYDHTFVLEQTHTKSLKWAASLFAENTALQMDLFTTEPSVHLYTGNYLEKTIGKNGKTFGRRTGLCLETQHFPDSPNHPHFPSTILRPNEVFESRTIFKLGVGK